MKTLSSYFYAFIPVLFLVVSCQKAKTPLNLGAFAEDLKFLQTHTEILVLRKGDAAVAVAPAYQGRVMTSTTDFQSGPSFGWINRPVIEKGFLSEEAKVGKLESHIYIFGGEERFWLGPEGGQFGLFFQPGTKFEFSRWSTPPPIDTEPFKVVSQTETSAVFHHDCQLTNYSGTVFKMGIDRTVRLLDQRETETLIVGKLAPGIRMVGYETDNRLTNRGDLPWIAESGLPSVWILGMYNPSSTVTVVIPFVPGSEAERGVKVKDNYFGKIPADYMKVEEAVIYFKGDGTRRGKIGVNPKRSKGVAGSYDAAGHVLTIVTYNRQEAPNGFVNSAWEIQKQPYGGDVINCRCASSWRAAWRT